jgi:hemolysin activation/secretion protein
MQNSANLKEMAERIQGMKPITVAKLERNLLLMSDLPGLEVKGVLKASPNVPKAADLYVLINRRKVQGQVQVDNRGSRYLGPGQATGSITFNDVFDGNDAITLRGATSYQTHEMKFGEVGYRRVLTPGGLTFDGAASLAVTHPGADLKPFDVDGRDSEVTAKLSYPLMRSRKDNLNVYGKLDVRDVDTKILGAQISKDHVRALRGGGVYTNRDDYLGANTVQAELSHGLDGFGASDRGDMVSRPKFNPDYTKVNMTLSREQGIRNSNFSFLGALTGQYSDSALLAPEEFGLGGEVFGSAYDPSEITGDSGAAARLEARYAMYPGNFVQVAQPYVFYDVGMVNNRDPGVGISSKQTLASYGAGMRVYAQKGVNAAVEVADPISRAVAANGQQTSPRVFFKLQKTF